MIKGLLSFIALLASFTSLCQNQKLSDSLKVEFRKSKEDFVKTKVLLDILSNEQNRDSVIFYSYILADISTKNKDENGLYNAYLNIASSFYQKGELEKALDFYYKSLVNASDSLRRASVYADMGSVYQHNEDFKNAYINYQKAIDVFLLIGDSLRLGTTYISSGYAYFLNDELDSATDYLQDAIQIFTSLDIEYSDYYFSYAEGNLALVLAKKGEIDESGKRLSNAIEILEKYGDAYAISEYKIELAKIYFAKGDEKKGLEFALSGTEMARANGYKKFIRDGSEVLSILYQDRMEYEKAFQYQSDFMAYNDSLINADLVRKLANQRTEFEVGQKQAEVDLLTAEQKIQQIILYATAAFALVFIVLASIIYKYYRSKNRVNKILAQQKIELESLNETKDKFFSIISHDIRGPVASFNGIGHMIKYFVKSKETDQLLEVADHIDQSVDQLSKLLDNLLAWAMQQQGQFPNVPEKLDLNEIADDLVKTLSNMAEGKKITLSSSIEDSIMLWSDRNSTMTILRNLVSNSLKFTPEGGSVTIEAYSKEDSAEIRVVDTGVGISKDKLDKLFQLEDDKSTYGTSGEKGLGLGLQLVHEFLEMNNGRIQVESEEGKGSTFIITLPLFEKTSQLSQV